MDNNEFMNLLAVVNKNHNKRNQLIVLGVIAGLAITGCYILSIRYKETNKKYNELIAKHSIDKVRLAMKDGHISRLNNTLKQLIAEKDIKQNDTPDNNTSLSQGTTS